MSGGLGVPRCPLCPLVALVTLETDACRLAGCKHTHTHTNDNHLQALQRLPNLHVLCSGSTGLVVPCHDSSNVLQKSGMLSMEC